MLEKLLGAKDGTCEECKAQSVARLTELSDFFSGDKVSHIDIDYLFLIGQSCLIA